VSYHGGTINLTGDFISPGIFSSGTSATVTTDLGTTIVVSALPTGVAPEGIEAFAGGGAALVTAGSTIIVNGNSTNPVGDYRFQPKGIQAQSNFGPVVVDYNPSPCVTGMPCGITVNGQYGIGIVATSGSSGTTTPSGNVTVNASGPINAGGYGAVGIFADSGNARDSARGFPTTSIAGPVLVTASNVSAQGQYGTAISATGGNGGVTVTIPSGASIMGGWQPDVTSGGANYGLKAAGIYLGAAGIGTATLNNDGSIGALSDRAIASVQALTAGPPVAGRPAVPSSTSTSIINNNSTITGFVELGAGQNSIFNNNTFNLRHFADTDGDGMRDTVRVAVADLGTGASNKFFNNGTLTLLRVTGATTLDSTGQYLPVANTSLGNFSNTMALGGPLQGQIIGAAEFTNSGTIDLQNNPVPGDVLMITGGRGGFAPGTGGGGTFISNGGSLLLDTVLNEGGAATVSDTLVVDGTSVGPKGATQTFVRNAGGAGAFTPGDGILVVEVLDQTRSAAGAFTLANPGQAIDAGPWEYRLFQGGVQGSNPGDWFLRSTFIPTEPEPVPPEPPVPLPPGVDPIIGPRWATYGVVQPLARQLGLDILGTLHERGGDTFEPDCVATAVATELPTKKSADGLPTKKPGPPPVSCPLAVSPSVWARFFGGTFNDRYDAFAEPRADGNFWGFQGGVDLLRGSVFPGHYDRAGFFVAYGVSDANVDGLVTNPAATAYIFQRTGSINLDAWSGGAYWTHVGPAGWYLDGVLQGTTYYGNASTPVSRLVTDGWGFLASLEGGYPIPLGFWPRLVLEPQGQIIWQHVGFNQQFDGIDPIGLGSTSGWTGRVGLLAQSTIVTDSGQLWQPYVRANLWHDWDANAGTTFYPSPIQVPLLEGATRLEFAGGGTVKTNPNWSFFGQAGYQFAVASSNNVRRNGFTGDFGLRYTW
jgi:outer membrane autotransporter protein